ncbi:hypothetical protein L6475_11890 [Prevotella sp. E9-3]|uniref:hypothetical protein n=1 Tax=Prevotella sp. E9-3 TaxID=2913621 RepID=UPI001EDA869B|nr:hypothetical protein [Prevotella sp. E9-3]UKK47905.1 hypothetical protein L6475_11890 [Prevotella sp. E9-3]
MKNCKFLFLFAVLAVSGCGDDDNDITKENGGSGDSNFTPSELIVKGQVEKGPFISGSTINMQPMNDQLKAIGSTYSTTITDDAGSFTFSPEKFEQPYARLSVNGYFYNEYKGKLSNGQITLQSVVDLQDKATVNVNLLTHLKYQRIMNLVEEGKSFKEANAQAQEELFRDFGLQKFNTTDASQFSVAAGTDEAAALIVFSSLLLGNRSEAEFTEYLAKLCADFADDGQFIEANKAQFSKDLENLVDKLDNISKHLVERYKQLGRDITVKDLINYGDWDGNGVVGDEAHDPSKPLNLSTDHIEAPAEGGTYQITFTSDVQLYLTPRKEETNSTESERCLTYVGSVSLEKELKDNQTLIVTIKPTESRSVWPTTVCLYDFMDNVVAKISISQAAYPNGRFLTGIGSQFFENVANGFIRNYYDSVVDEVTRIFRERYLNGRDVIDYHLDDVLNVYLALALIKADRDYYFDYNNGREVSLSELEPELKKAIANLGEHRVGNCQSAEQMALLSADIARFVLAKIYDKEHRLTERNELLQAIVNNGFYDEYNSVIFALYGKELINYYMVSNMLNSSN